MAIPLTYTGTEYITSENAQGYGYLVSPNPPTRLTDMINNQYYYTELIGNDTDTLVVNCEGFFVSLFKTYTNQRLMNSFVFRMTFVNGQNRIRLVQRGLAVMFTFEQALRSVGESVTLSDDYSGTMVALNQQLAPFLIQVYKNF